MVCGPIGWGFEPLYLPYSFLYENSLSFFSVNWTQTNSSLHHPRLQHNPMTRRITDWFFTKIVHHSIVVSSGEYFVYGSKRETIFRTSYTYFFRHIDLTIK